MRFSLQDMVRQTLAEAERREKTAAAGNDDGDEDKKKGVHTPPVNPATAPDRNEQSIEEKTSSVFVSKLANAVEYLNANWIKKEAVGEVLAPPPAIMPSAHKNVGAGKGPGAFATNLEHPTTGEQSTEVGHATAEKILPMNPPMGGYGKHDTNPGTLFKNDIDNPPGGKESWKHKDVMKQAGIGSYFKPIEGLKDIGSAITGKMGKHVLTDNTRKQLVSRAAKRVLPTAAVGAAGLYGAGKVFGAGANSNKIASVLRKLAGDVPPDSSASEEGVPSLPSEAAKQEKLIDSMQAAINYTKAQAKAVPKDRMGEVLSEPAQKKTLDPVLQNNLSATGQAGVKISAAQSLAARALLEKIAEEGAKEDASSEEKEKGSRLSELFKAKQKEKSSQGVGLSGGSSGSSFNTGSSF